MVPYFVKRFSLTGLAGIDRDDLIQEGNAALIRAAESFDPRVHRTRFSTYSAWWIYSRVRACILNQGSTIRTPIHIHERGLQDKLKPRMQLHPIGLAASRPLAPIDELIEGEHRVDLFSAISRLSPNQRFILNWYLCDYANESPARRKSDVIIRREKSARRLVAKLRAQLNPEGAVCA